MTGNDTSLNIMSQATEDMTGLWELAALSQSPTVDALIAVLTTLVGEGLVAVYRGTEFASEEVALSAPDARAAIRDGRFWDWSAPDHGPHLRIFATPQGQKWYQEHFGSPADTRLAS